MELLVVVAIIGILAAVSIPLIANYWRSAAVRGGAQEMRTALQQAKQLAIRNRQNVCVQPVLNGYQFRQDTCAGAVIVLPGVDGTGTFRLQNNVTVALNAGPPIFTQLGAAAPGGQFRVIGPSGNAVTITVTPSGQITTP